MKRKLNVPKDLLLTISKNIVVGKTRLPWTPYHGERAGIKLHVAYDAQTEQPNKGVESITLVMMGCGETLADLNLF